MLGILNADRAQYGVPSLALNTTQSYGAGSCVGSIGHSQAMMQSGNIWHTNPDYPAASFPNNICVNVSAAGENVGMYGGAGELTALRALDGMMMQEPHDSGTCANSVNHACNIINPRYTSVGLGIIYSGGSTWLTEDFIG